MKRIIIAAFVIGLVFSPSVFAQNWTPDQIEVLETVKTGWTLWQEAIKKKDVNIWLDGMNPTEDFQGWWTSEGGLYELIDVRTFDIILDRRKDFTWEYLHPLSIRIFDDTALIYFYATYNVQDHSGVWTRREDKRLEVFKREDGKWRWTGAMVEGKQKG
jgi:hypothetical protein